MQDGSDPGAANRQAMTEQERKACIEQERKVLIERVRGRFRATDPSGAALDRAEEGPLSREAAGWPRDERGDEGADASSGRLSGPLAGCIDHTALKPGTTVEDVRRLCEEARLYGFAAVCVNPCYVALAAGRLEGTPVATCTVIGFPLGASATVTKAFETHRAVRDGAREVDVVVNIGMLKSGRWDYVESDLRAVVRAARSAGAITKVILETALLTDEEKVTACVLAQNAGARFVKTSTGFARGGATPSDVSLMRSTVGRAMEVKASGGIRTAEAALSMIASGASRIGTSSSVEIVRNHGETVRN